MGVLMEDRCCLLVCLSPSLGSVFSITYWTCGAVQESVSGCSLADWPCKELAAHGACVMFYVAVLVAATHYPAHPFVGIPPEKKPNGSVLKSSKMESIAREQLHAHRPHSRVLSNLISDSLVILTHTILPPSNI